MACALKSEEESEMGGRKDSTWPLLALKAEVRGHERSNVDGKTREQVLLYNGQKEAQSYP